MLSSNFPGLTKPERKQFDPLPEDTYQVAISDITDKVKKNFEGDDQLGLDFEFVILDEGAYRGRRLWKFVRPVVSAGPSNNKPSWLYTIIDKTLGSDVALAAQNDPTVVNVTTLIGKQLRVVVNQTQGRNGNVYNNIVQFQVKKGDLEPFEKSEPTGVQPTPLKAGEEKAATVRAIFAMAPKLWPTLQALGGAAAKKEKLKEFIDRDLSIRIESFSAAALDVLKEAYMAMKTLESSRIVASMKQEQPVEQVEEAINIEDIPF